MILNCSKVTLLTFLVQVLQTGREINEVDQSGFSTDGATVYAGNLGSNKYIIQVIWMKKCICLFYFKI